MKKFKRALRCSWVGLRLYRIRYVRWWRKQDKKYTWRWRAANLLAVVLVMVGIVLPIAEEFWQNSRYTLSAEASQLVGHTDPSLAKQLTYDSQNKQYQFNKDAVATGDDTGMPAELQKASVGAADKSNAKTYSLDVPEDFSKGVTYHDTNSQLSFSLVPQFDALRGKIVDGHLVFPMSNDTQAVYTLKNNGLKEDIVVPKVTERTMSYSYDLQLPKTLEVRSLPDHSGGIGIYSVDPSLYGDIAFGSDKDRQEVEKARINGNKTFLVFGLPAPVVKDTDGKEAGTARFELKGNSLSVVAEGLKTDVGPITIDPSVVVTSASDFQTGGNNEGMIDFGTSGQITRGGLTGGTVGSWGTTNAYVGPGLTGTGAVAYNGYMYVLGGNDGNSQRSAVEYAAINSNGTVGSWTATNPMTDYRAYPGAAVYNGYLYAIGGSTTGWSILSTVEYAKINSDGSVGTWQTTNSLPSVNGSGVAVAYSGYMYLLGGSNGTVQNSVLYAKINANGTLGTWSSTTSFTTARANQNSFAYNGYMYVMGGYNGTSTYYNDAQYAKINDDGTVGTWTATTSFTTARSGAFGSIYNGYVYLYGGTATANSSFDAFNDTQYAQINANGKLSAWRTTSTLSVKRAGGAGIAYNGYVYAVGGADAFSGPVRVQYAQLDRAGQPVAFGTLTNNFTTARALACSVAYNGYLYVVGGSTTDSGNNNVATVRYTALDSSTGNNGAWSTATALPAGRGSSGCVAHNGYLYVVGGFTGASVTSKSVLYIAINSNGTLGASWTTSGNSLTNDAEFKPGVFTYGTSDGMYMYVLGGCDAIGTTCDNTYYAPLNASTGAVGGWTVSGNSMVNQYKARGYAQVGKYLYAFGGEDGASTVYSATEYTSINNDGSINAWASTTGLNTGMDFVNGTTVNGCIYQVGGENPNGTLQAIVQYACPAANGTISAWYNAPNLTVATTDMGVTSYNGYIYGVGGYTTSVQTTTQYAYVNNGGSGSNGTWTQSGNQLTGSTYASGAVAYNGYVYTVGGTTGNGAKNNVQYSALGADGNPGSFSNDAHTISGARANLGAVAYNGYLYALGGATDGGSTRYGDVQYAPVGSSGALSGNFTSTTNFVSGTGSDTAREGVCAVAYNGYMYAIGGYDGTSSHADIRYAAINANGTLGTWANSGNNLGAAEDHPNGCFAANGYMYMVGYDNVQAAPVNSNGTLGAWKYTSRFHLDRFGAAVAYGNGFVYMYGGCSGACSSYYGDTQYAPVYANGTLGAWQRSTAIFGSTTQGYTAGLVANGNLYMFGGEADSRVYVYYAPLSVISRTARYSKLVDLGNPVSISSITYNGVLPTSVSTPGVAPISFRAAGSDGVFGSATLPSAITAGATACLPTSQNYKRYLLVTITLDGSGGQAILPDAAGTYSNVTDFTVNYITPHPNPNIRLRHGQTLQTGNLGPLDSCFDGLLASYGFNEGSGSTAGSARWGTMTVGPSASWTTGHGGGSALSSNGGGAQGGYTPWNNMVMTNATIMAWCKPTDLTAGTVRPLFGVAQGNDTSSNSEFNLWAQRGDFGTPNILQGNVRVNGTLQPIYGPALTNNTWVHLALSYDGANIRLYVNGALYATVAASGTNTGGNYFLDVLSGVGNAYGVVDDVQVYGRTLSATDIATAMNTSVP
ncbi:hypothetical protein EYC59_03020 [Candidatus Saccharibacteria bacterium]|nr:MAG: hypothetical protein EYC59_03020 [Candidatus Saccharibacteria bacterium]